MKEFFLIFLLYFQQEDIKFVKGKEFASVEKEPLEGWWALVEKGDSGYEVIPTKLTRSKSSIYCEPAGDTINFYTYKAEINNAYILLYGLKLQKGFIQRIKGKIEKTTLSNENLEKIKSITFTYEGKEYKIWFEGNEFEGGNLLIRRGDKIDTILDVATSLEEVKAFDLNKDKRLDFIITFNSLGLGFEPDVILLISENESYKIIQSQKDGICGE